jgi:hypothetical protein
MVLVTLSTWRQRSRSLSQLTISLNVTHLRLVLSRSSLPPTLHTNPLKMEQSLTKLPSALVTNQAPKSVQLCGPTCATTLDPTQFGTGWATTCMLIQTTRKSSVPRTMLLAMILFIPSLVLLRCLRFQRLEHGMVRYKVLGNGFTPFHHRALKPTTLN